MTRNKIIKSNIQSILYVQSIELYQRYAYKIISKLPNKKKQSFKVIYRVVTLMYRVYLMYIKYTLCKMYESISKICI